MSGDAFIEFRSLTKVFFGERGHETPVVEPLSLKIAEGEFVVFVGPSGCGKTTVMRMVGGLETPTSGQVLLRNSAVKGPSREKGMVFQSYSSFPWLTVLGNIRFGLQVPGTMWGRRKKTGLRGTISISSGSRRSPTFTSTASLAACASAWRLPARSPPTRWFS